MNTQIFEPFKKRRRLLLGYSNLTIGAALKADRLTFSWASRPSADDSGNAVLILTDFREVLRCYLEAPVIRITVAIPKTVDSFLRRFRWMLHAGSRSPDRATADAALEVIELQEEILGLPELEQFAIDVAKARQHAPQFIDALIIGDHDDVGDMLDNWQIAELPQAEALRISCVILVLWGVLEEQRNAALGWQNMYQPFGLGAEAGGYWTIGQIFNPEVKKHKFMCEMLDLYQNNRAAGVEEITDGRTINRYYKTLRSIGYGWINKRNEQEIIAAFGHRVGTLPQSIRAARTHGANIRTQLDEALRPTVTGAGALDPNVPASRAGKRMDAYFAPISAVLQATIVAARVHELALRANDVTSPEGFRDLLRLPMPRVLTPCKTKALDQDKANARQLLNIARACFLKDPEHLPLAARGATKNRIPDPELKDTQKRRARELFDEAGGELRKQPQDWAFMTLVGWECDSGFRYEMRALTAGPSHPKSSAAGQTIN